MSSLTNRRLAFCFLMLLFFFAPSISSFAQDKKVEIPSATVFSLPSSPAFALLDINPAQVNRPGYLRDFKLDWVMEKGQLSPNIAIDAQPIWLLFFKNVGLSQYVHDVKWWGKTLSTLTFSLGTHEKDDARSLAYSFKISLIRYDILEDQKFSEDLDEALKDPPDVEVIIKTRVEKQFIIDDKNKEKTAPGIPKEAVDRLNKEIKALNDEIRALDESLGKYDEETKGKIKALLIKYKEVDHWNEPFLDLGYGNLYSYSGATIGTLKLENKGMGLWMNGGFGIGKNIFVCGLARYIDSIKNETHEKQYLGGMNLRYGSPKFNLFIEGVYENDKNQNKYTIAYGGDFKINPNIVLQFGIRTEYNKSFNFSNLIPLVNVTWIQN